MNPPAASEIVETPAVGRRRPWLDTDSQAFGLLCGCTLTVGASTSFAYARAGILAGFTPGDLVVLRFGVSALLLLPLLLRWGLVSLAGVGWPRALALTALGGPAFALMQSGGYAFAPLAHGAVIHPASVTILSTVAAALLLRERLGPAHIVGAAIVVLGILLISWHGLNEPASPRSWIGDLCFFTSAVLWAGFTLLIRVWRLPAIRAIGVTSLLSALITLPLYLIWYGRLRLLDMPPAQLGVQALTQGVLQGAIAITAYAHSVRVLGVSRAVLFPASVPAISVLLGILVVGEVPGGVQIAGLGLVTLGMLTAIGLLRIPRRTPARDTTGAG